MKSKVLYSNAHASAKINRLDKVRSLFQRSGFNEFLSRGDRVAVKVHWGEYGNVGFIPPPFVRVVVDEIRKSGALPYVTDTNTLYTGMRRNAVQNLEAAAMNGYTQLTLNAPLVVADGLIGRDFREIEVEKGWVNTAKIASGILDADAMIVLSHVKGHMLFGFGGALKNLGMGCATPAGKQILHSDVRPKVDPERCTADSICIDRCPVGCITLIDHAESRKIARIDSDRCIGCAECTAACPHQAIPINWRSSAEALQKKTADYAWASLAGKRKKVGFINFIIQVTPDCDCCDWNDIAFVPDLGFLASSDPVAIDAASLDLVLQTPPIPGSRADKTQGDDIWRKVNDVDYRIIIEHAQYLGLGSGEYQIVKIG